ncbi:MAG: TatD family hydrolase [Bacteroidales bacterium]|nr:TatD family hydrolase [Bacteroidales bacterium]
MYIDIHRHSEDNGKAQFVLRNLFPDQLSEIRPNNYYSVGLHPWFVNENSLNTDIRSIDEVCNSRNILALGETGLDKVKPIPFEWQLKAFQKQVELAESIQKPVIIHCVKAYSEVISIRKKLKATQPWIFHWFNASMQLAKELIEGGCYMSFGHMLFHKNSRACKSFLEVPFDKLFLETDDASYNIEEIYKQASVLRKISEEELIQQVIRNFEKVFKIEIKDVL